MGQSVCGPNIVVFLHRTCQLEEQSYLWRCCFWEITICFHPLLWWWLWKGKTQVTWSLRWWWSWKRSCLLGATKLCLKRQSFVSSLGVRSTGQLYVFISVLLTYLRKGLFLSLLETVWQPEPIQTHTWTLWMTPKSRSYFASFFCVLITELWKDTKCLTADWLSFFKSLGTFSVSAKSKWH